jgi:hypothetical protein
MKKFFYTLAFLLTFSYAFANNLENGLHKIKQNSKLTSYSQSNKINDATALTLSYDVATFCAGTYGISKPNVNEEGGFYTYARNANTTTGYLIINPRTGMVDHFISDPGVYTITYKKGDASVSATITVNKCN